MYHLKGNDESFPKCNFDKIEVLNQSYGHLSGIWPILVDFTMTSHSLFPNHVTEGISFEFFFTSPGLVLNSRKSHQIAKSHSTKALQELWTKTFGVLKTPWPE